MKKVLVTTGLFVSFFAVGAFAETMNGTISDEHCGAKHVNAKEADAACVKKCMDGGAAAVFVVGDKVYKIDNQDAVKGHEGHQVTINGKVNGDSVHVDSVKMM
jgi:hypothetical protein